MMFYAYSNLRPRCWVVAGLFILLSAVSGRAAEPGVVLRGHLSPFPGPNRYGDVWGEGNYAYLASYNGNGVMIIDISNPSAPVLAGYYNPAVGGRFQDVVVIKGIGYFSSENGGGVHIVDVRQPASPVLIGQISPAIGGYSLVHELAFAEGLLYEADSRTPVVKVFDVTNAAAPLFVRSIQTTDTFFIHAITAINGRLYTSGWSGRTDIWDVTNIRLAPPTLLGVVLTGERSHSSCVGSDGRLLVSARETINGDVRIFDISDPGQPIMRSAINAQTLGINAFTPHNPYLVGNLLFVSWYQAGLQVIDISDPSAPKLVGSFDTFDEGTSGVSGYQGNWGVFPFLGLDRVLLSDLDGGLFIVDATATTPFPRTVSAASFTPGAVAAKAIVAAFGTDLTANTSTAGVLPLPTSLGSTTVKVIDSRGIERLAPLFFVSPTQINYQIPAGSAEGPAAVVVTGSSGRISSGVTIIKATAPAVFTQNQNGEGAAAAIDGLTSAAAPFAATSANGMPNVIAVFASGLGEDATDMNGDVSATVEALIDGISVSVLYAGRAPGFTGLNQLNIVLPVGVASGTHSLVVKRAGIAGRTVTIQTR